MSVDGEREEIKKSVISLIVSWIRENFSGDPVAQKDFSTWENIEKAMYSETARLDEQFDSLSQPSALIDSLDSVELLMFLEDKLGMQANIDIPDGEVTYKGLVDIIVDQYMREKVAT
jgi:acyl carrier protein